MIKMIKKRIAQLKNLVKFEKQNAVVKTKGEIKFQKRVDKVLHEKDRDQRYKLAEQKTLPPEVRQKLEKINLLHEKAVKEEKLGQYPRVLGRYEFLLELYKSIPKEIMNFTKEIYETENKIESIREKI